ncbi:MAG: hypothetical protein K2X47_09630, partial [Bdellovibrionales bacterium]|nr:hypothetical protein [Bdellovibrionales bacterium]
MRNFSFFKVLALVSVLGTSQAMAAGISGNQISCSGGLCTFAINWSVGGSGSSSVVTVKEPDGDEQVYACGGSSGSGSAPWVPDGGSLIFKVYETSYCASDVSQVVSAAAQTTVTGNSTPRRDGYFCVCQGYEAMTSCF